MSRTRYVKIVDFGSDTKSKNPLAICFGNTINNKFEAGVLGGSIAGQSSYNCQKLLSQYCSNNWDQFCDMASQNINSNYPNTFLNFL